MKKSQADVQPLIDIMQTLLGPQGCPWDKEQTLNSLRPFVIEEAFEVVDAIDSNEPDCIREELGDLLLQIVFQSELTQKNGWFGFQDIVQSICEKLIRRHPWVFGDQTAKDSTQALKQWELIKAKEKKDRGVLDGVPNALPALLRSVRVGEKASGVGFDWSDSQGAREKINEELRELDEALASKHQEDIEKELGDLLFSIANFARKINVDPEASLRGTINRFTKRFRYVEAKVKEKQQDFINVDPEEMEKYWQEAKEHES